MATIDLTDPEQRRKAVASGLIWSAPQGAVVAALRDMKAGTIPTPDYIPSEWRAIAESLGVTPSEPSPLGDEPA